MARKPKKPRIKANPEQAERIRKLAQIGATVKEMADIERCSDEFINIHYMDQMKEGRAELKLSLRRAQIRLAIEKQNCTMMIWLGKQFLGQRDILPEDKPDNNTMESGRVAFIDELKKLNETKSNGNI